MPPMSNGIFALIMGTTIALVGGLLTIITRLKDVVDSYRLFKATLLRRKIIVGVRDKIPQSLVRYPLYDDLSKSAIADSHKIILVRYKNYSWALRRCTWVVEDGPDRKMVAAENETFWEALVTENPEG
jgi:hypothetical protein